MLWCVLYQGVYECVDQVGLKVTINIYEYMIMVAVNQACTALMLFSPQEQQLKE